MNINEYQVFFSFVHKVFSVAIIFVRKMYLQKFLDHFKIFIHKINIKLQKQQKIVEK